jgi:hypothetical protein
MGRMRVIVVGGAATLAATLIGFCLGAFAVAAYCNRVLVPAWVKQYPHDGQIGLAVFVYAINGGALVSLIVLLIGIVWTAVKASHVRPV